MPAVRGAIVRPLLGASRAQVLDFLAARGAGYLEDPSNADLRFLRARVRHLLMPRLDPTRLVTIATTATRLRERVDRQADLDAREPALRVAALRRLYREAGGADPGLARQHLAAMERLARTRRTGATVNLPNNLVFRVLPAGLEIAPAAKQNPLAWSVHERTCNGCAEPGAAHLKKGRLSVGRRIPGLRLRRPAGTRKLQDLLVDAKVPRHQRDGLPLVFLDGRLAWVPGVAVDLTATTTQALPGRHVWVEGVATGRW
jgi:tRNA(Ile)-lysidine synthase